MNKKNGQLFLLFGLWLSFVSMIFSGGILFPNIAGKSESQAALLYKFAVNKTAGESAAALEEGSALVADLDVMELSVYENGVLKRTFPILSKGREGTPWETPTGKYVIQTKEVKHYSSIGGTWMPYSMQFYGNYFIHGWPTYTNGKSVPTGYSGGCIRLGTEDARELYALTPKGTKLLVLGGAGKDMFATTSRYYLRGEGDLPTVSSQSFIVADLDTGSVLWERRGTTLYTPKNLTAMATALTALETVNQYKVVRMSEVLLGKSVLRKHPIGTLDELPVGTLIYPLLFDTNDTAAKVFGHEHGLKQFVKYMNEKSAAIGMENTVFSGVLSGDEGTTTARDLLRLLSYVERYKHFLIDVTLSKEQTLSNARGGKRYSWENKNPWILSGDGSYRGGLAALDGEKAGSGILLFSLPVSEFGERTVAFVVLESDDLVADVSALRTFVRDHFVYGIERAEEEFIREPNDPTPALLEKAKNLIDLEKLLQDEIEYEREV